MTFNLFDIVYIGLLVVFTLLASLRGALKELFSLLGLVGGFLAATWYADPVGEQLGHLLPDQEVAGLLAFVLIMLVGYFVGVFVSGVSDFFRNGPAGGLSRTLGGVIGFGKGLVFSLALYWVIVNYIPPFQDEMAASWMGAWLSQILDHLQRLNVI